MAPAGLRQVNGTLHLIQLPFFLSAMSFCNPPPKLGILKLFSSQVRGEAEAGK